MSEELVNINALPPAPYDSDMFGSLVTSSDFLPRIQLMGGNSKAVTESKIGSGHYALVHDAQSLDDMGTDFDCLMLSWRPLALRTDGDDVMSVFDPSNEEFLKIKDESEDQDSGCMYGVQFIVWLPEHETFATFFAASKTARREARNVHKLCVNPETKQMEPTRLTFRVRLASNKKYKWHAPQVVKCSTPFNMPTDEAVLKEVERFQNPPKDGRETVEDDDSGRVR